MQVHRLAGRKHKVINQNKRILLIENDASLSRSLITYLVEKNYNCLNVPTLKSAYQLLDNYVFDLIILDRILDDGDGFELIHYITDISYPTKILVLSQMGELTERISGLSVGADDYLPKPFSLKELLLKIDILIRRQKMLSRDTLRVGGVVLHTESALLVINGQDKSTIRRRETDILACLMRHKNQVLSKTQIIKMVWKNEVDVPTHTTVDVYVRRIRIHLKKCHKLLGTVRGLGYIFKDL